MNLGFNIHSIISRLVFLVFGLGLSDLGFCQIAIAPKQLLVIKPGVDRIHGTWVAAVMNRGQKPEVFSVPVMLPKESRDFQPVEGVEPADIKLETDGVYVNKAFPPGVNVLSFAFISDAKHGRAELNIQAKSDVGELSVMTPRGMLSISGQEFLDSGSDVQDLQMYDILTSRSQIAKGDELRLSISEVPEGRMRLWFFGGSFALLLCIAAGYLTWRTSDIEKVKLDF
jgi:hypothetical protein